MTRQGRVAEFRRIAASGLCAKLEMNGTQADVKKFASDD